MSTAQLPIGAGYLAQDVAAEEVLTPEDLGEEQRMMIHAIKDFAVKDVMPVVSEIEKRNIDVIRPLFRKAAELGIFMAEVPEEYGGLGLSVLSIAGMNESRSALGPLASTVFAHQGIGTLPLINFGTKAQIEQYLDRCMSGEIMAAFALTEPSSGSDAMNIRTTAVLNETGTHFYVNGSKQFITNAGWADLFILFAKVNGTAFTAFLLERDSPGLTVGENEKLLGLHGSSVCGLTLNDVKIPAENVLGEVGMGHKVAMCTLNLGRMKMAANCAGSAKKALEVAAQYAAEREQFGTTLHNFGAIQAKLGEMAARVYAAESVAYRTAGLVYTALEAMGEEEKKTINAKLKTLTEFSVECALAKVFGAETYNKVADETLQIHGGYGFSEEYPAAKMYRDARITRIYEGTSEICRLSAAKTILRKLSTLDTPLAAALESATNMDEAAGSSTPVEGLRVVQQQIALLKQIYRRLLRLLVDRFGPEQLLDNENQQYLLSLSDIAMEIYAAESSVLRVLKLQHHHMHGSAEMPEAMARLCFERAADRVRQESTEILAALFEDRALDDELQILEKHLPAPINRMRLQQFIARELVANNGALPEYHN